LNTGSTISGAGHQVTELQAKSDHLGQRVLQRVPHHYAHQARPLARAVRT